MPPCALTQLVLKGAASARSKIISSYVEGSLLLEVKKEVEAELRDDLAGLKPEEAAVLSLLQARLSICRDGAPDRQGYDSRRLEADGKPRRGGG
jgi:DNA topoisomerase I